MTEIALWSRWVQTTGRAPGKSSGGNKGRTLTVIGQSPTQVYFRYDNGRRGTADKSNWLLHFEPESLLELR